MELTNEALTEAKAAVSARLRAADLSVYRLHEADPRLEIYVREVCGDPDGHNLWEQLAVERTLRLVSKYGLDAGAVKRFVVFYEFLYFPGKRGPTRYKLTPVQVYQYANMYGLRDEEGRRLVREAVLFVPRKFSKTTSSAAVAIYDLLFGEANAESYTAANSNDQAKKCFDAIRGAMRRLDPDGRRYVVNEQVIKSRRKDRTAFAQCLTANARTKDGLNASTVIMDEFSQAKDAELLSVLTTSMGTRTSPLTVIITTASDVMEGPFHSMLDGYKRLLMGEYDDPTVFAHLFEPDLGDDEGDPATWRKVHPHMGVTVSERFYRREYTAAVRNGAAALLAFRTKLLNLYTEHTVRAWITAAAARAASVPFDPRAVKGRPPAMLGIDLSERDDFTAISAAVYDRDRHHMMMHTAYFLPEGGVRGHANERLLRAWEKAGWLYVLPGEVIDYKAITDYVLQLADTLDIRGIGFDPWKSQELINMLGNAGGREVLKGVRQTYGHFTAAVQSFEHNLHLGNIHMNDNPINAYCFGNAMLDTDRIGNMKPQKRRGAADKIDGVITMLMAYKLWLEAEV